MFQLHFSLTKERGGKKKELYYNTYFAKLLVSNESYDFLH